MSLIRAIALYDKEGKLVHHSNKASIELESEHERDDGVKVYEFTVTPEDGSGVAHEWR